jgi:hypothetical protein
MGYRNGKKLQITVLTDLENDKNMSNKKHNSKRRYKVI